MRKSKRLLMCVVILCLSTIASFGQEKRTVSGTVQDSAGIAIPGASVNIKGKRTGTTTDNQGHFKISAAANETLVVSAIGYAQIEQSAASATVSVTLGATRATMDQVVVTAMGNKRSARSLGYSVATISAKDMTESGATNIVSAIYGKAAGVRISTAPGGAGSAVNVTVRGIGSLSGNTQPLYVVDGIPIRLYNDLSGNAGSDANNGGYWDNQRVRGNGVLDLNPEDIESMTILKGASASALYGSEAASGVIVITTKKGSKAKGLGVSFNYLINQEKVAYGPDYQNDYGPGYSSYTNASNGIAVDAATGWATDTDGSQHPYYRAYQQFGPKFDGRDVKYWDGTTRKYVANKNNYLDFYQTGYNSNANLALSNASDKGSYRFSYSRIDYKSIMPGNNIAKNNFNLNSSMKLNDKVSLDVVSTFNNSYNHNRTYLLNQIFNSYAGFFNRMDDMSTYKNKAITSDGYKYVGYTTTPQYDADEVFKYNIRATNLLDYFWTALRDYYGEKTNRFINSAALNVAFTDHLKMRVRIGNDFTSFGIEEENHNTEPASLGYTGGYHVTNNTYNIIYGDGQLNYTNKINKDLDFSLSGGVTGRKQMFRYQYSTTNGGLVNENWFSLNNSATAVTSSATRAEQVDVSTFGVLNLNYKNFLYLEGTGRYEATSTLPTGVNNYFYPSVNAGFILSDAVKLPDFFNYAKLRGSYGIVGNHPNIYASNVAYSQSSITYNSSNVLYQSMTGSGFGNNAIRSEKKIESEFGLETRFLHDRVGVDFSFYTNKTDRQILTVSTPSSSGATSFLTNAGDLSNYGFEAAINGRILAGKNFGWNARFNFSINKNKLTSLNGLSNLTSTSQDGGYLIVRAQVGDPIGNIYTHPIATDGKGNAIIDDGGYYTVDANSYKYAGNIMPKVVGGFSNTFTYKNFALDINMDYRLGGDLISIGTYYNIGAGMYKSTLQYRDAAHGGLAYNVNNYATGDFTQDANGSRHDGVVLKGVTSTGATNTKVIEAADYYINTYNWETAGDYSRAVFKNSYIKVREMVFSYNLPKAIATKLRFQNLQLSAVGRNLFYVYKSLPHGLDPEVAIGSSWLSQGIDVGAGAPTRSLGVSFKATF